MDRIEWLRYYWCVQTFDLGLYSLSKGIAYETVENSDSLGVVLSGVLRFVHVDVVNQLTQQRRGQSFHFH